ncbi:MAG TPA: hypothetical protein K8V35_00400 [Aliicoccus persicus]|uniref:Uncharacterized protein n=1 Tax=Aliicoccus persicus TaxID=930138 RepID=A0A921DVK2_9STAP|nr:hypothetical protein [Aliicoccus persicus]
MKRYMKPALIFGVSMLLFSHVQVATADSPDYNESEDVNTEEQVDEQVSESPNSNVANTSKRDIEFETIYEPDKKPKDETPQEEPSEKEEGSNVLAPAEPEEDIDGIVNNDDEEVGEDEADEETTIETPNEEAPDDSEDIEEDTEVSEETPDEESEEDIDSEETEEENEEEPIEEAPVLDERGKITDEGLNRLDDRVNRVMSEKITKSDQSRKSKNRDDVDKEADDEFIIERMQKFLSQQSAFSNQDKTFVHELVVDKIIVKYMRPVRLPL